MSKELVAATGGPATQGITDEQYAKLDDIYQQSPIGALNPEQACYEVSTKIQRELGWTQTSGYYGDEGHYWNVLPDGTIVDAAHDQFDEDSPINVIAPSQGDYSMYRTHGQDRRLGGIVSAEDVREIQDTRASVASTVL